MTTHPLPHDAGAGANDAGQHRTPTPLLNTWNTSKSIGTSGERRYAACLTRRGYHCFIGEGKTPFDLILYHRVECKTDDMALRTGNVAVEVSYRNEPSGILLPEAAPLWAFIIGDDAYQVSRTRLRSLLRTVSFPLVRAGDRKLTEVRLIPLSVLKELPGVQRFDLNETGVDL